MASLFGYTVYGEPWSPDGARLAYLDAATDSIGIFDALTPQSTPRRVAAGVFVSQVRWSPDGGWLLLIGSDGSPVPIRHLIAVRLPTSAVPGLEVELAPPNSEITHAVWGSDGNIYWWDLQTGKRTTLPPPPEWRMDNPSTFAERTHLLPRLVSQTRRLAQFVFETVPAVVETPIELSAPADSVDNVLGLDVVPGGQRFLLCVLGAPCSFTALVDRSGAILTRYWIPCPSGPPGGPFTFEGGGSISADGRFIIGYRDVEDGHSILSSELILTNLQSSWVADVAGSSGLLDARFAATGLFVACAPLDGGVEVGVLDVR
jgi:hypothetical protein